MIGRRGRAALAAALLLLPACDSLFPWHQPATRVWVSPTVPQCPGGDTTCAVLDPLPADLELLLRLGSDAVTGKARLARATGMTWSEARPPDGALHLDLPTPPEDTRESVYVLEVLRAEVAHDSLLTIASNGGTVVWLNGELLGASRAASRPARAHQDLYVVSLREGTNVVLYRVLLNGPDAQLHREWHPRVALPDLLTASINLGAYQALVKTPIVPDTATTLALWPPQVRLRDGPVVHFRWLDLLGDSLADGGRFPGEWPDALPLPGGPGGMAVLRTEVLDTSGQRLWLEETPVFAQSTARRLARTLAADTTTANPVRAARVDAVRAAFNLGPTPRGPDLGDWTRAQVLASLYRHVHQPDAFHRHPGPQVWGYRTLEGSVQPYWLTVPPAAVDPGAQDDPRGLVFSLNHYNDPDFWAGRGRINGFVLRLDAMGSSYGTFGVVPHLGGVHEFDSIAGEELPAILHQVASAFAIDTTAVGMLAWSRHAGEAVEVALDPRVSLDWLGLAVPRMNRNDRDLAVVLDSLRRVRPQLHWLVWQADRDTVVRQASTERWVGLVRAKGFDVRYRLVPYSTHLGGYYEDIEADLHRSVARARRP